jgi:hypothetical protein
MSRLARISLRQGYGTTGARPAKKIELIQHSLLARLDKRGEKCEV